MRMASSDHINTRHHVISCNNEILCYRCCKFVQIFANFCKFLQHLYFILLQYIHFILFYMCSWFNRLRDKRLRFEPTMTRLLLQLINDILLQFTFFCSSTKPTELSISLFLGTVLALTSRWTSRVQFDISLEQFVQQTVLRHSS